MDKGNVLNEIFDNDPLGLLEIRSRNTNAQTADERLLVSFQEINNFVDRNGKEPEPNPSNISEFQLYARLKSLRKDDEKIRLLAEHDMHHLLPVVEESQVGEPKDHRGGPSYSTSLQPT